jgi:adenine-specific DNA-methyltransferase
MAKKTTPPTKVESIRHKDKRANIPTEELRDFVAEDEGAPKTMLYPRDPSLDPQLVWKGKDAQDREDLAVPVVPIYIQEKIHPQAIINALPRIEQLDDDQPNLFADFNGGPVDFDQKIAHSIGFSGRQRSLFCQGQLDPGFPMHTLSSTTPLVRK